MLSLGNLVDHIQKELDGEITSFNSAFFFFTRLSVAYAFQI